MTVSKNPDNPLKLTPKGIAQMRMIAAGVNPKDALLITNPLKDTVSDVAVHKLKAKYKKYSLQNPQTVKLAHNQIKRILSGEERTLNQQRVTKEGQVVDYIETIAPSDTNIIAAASMVYDRYEPTVKSQEPGTSTHTYIDLSSIQVNVTTQEPMIDITPTPTDGSEVAT